MLAGMVRGHRLRRGLTQEDLARRTGLAERSIRDIEAGKVRRPRAVTVTTLADSFGLAGDEREAFFLCAFGQPRPAHEEQPPPQTSWPQEAHRRGVPAQLPLGPPDFVGRRRELQVLNNALGTGDGGNGAASVVVVSGMAGVGKSTLAVHWARCETARFPDGQLYLDFTGRPGGSAVRTRSALRQLLQALGTAEDAVPQDVATRVGLYRTLLARRRALVVLDNARDVGEIRPLLPGAATNKVIVTSRNEMSGLVAAEGASSLALDVIPAQDAYELLIRRLAHGDPPEPDAARRIVESCAGLPLALCAAAACARTRPHLPLSVLAAGVRDPAAVLDVLATNDSMTDLRRVFSLTFETLPPGPARVFRWLGRQAGEGPARIDVVPPDVARGLNWSTGAAAAALVELRREHFVQEPAPGRFTMHPLLQAYARDRAGDPEDAARHPRTVGGRYALATDTPLRAPGPTPPE